MGLLGPLGGYEPTGRGAAGTPRRSNQPEPGKGRDEQSPRTGSAGSRGQAHSTLAIYLPIYLSIYLESLHIVVWVKYFFIQYTSELRRCSLQQHGARLALVNSRISGVSFLLLGVWFLRLLRLAFPAARTKTCGRVCDQYKALTRPLSVHTQELEPLRALTEKTHLLRTLAYVSERGRCSASEVESAPLIEF